MRVSKVSPVAVVTLALGIAGCATVYSLVRPMLLSPLPYPAADRLVVIEERTPDKRAVPVSLPNYTEWTRQTNAFAQAGAHSVGFFSLTGIDQPEQIAGGLLTASLLRTLGVQPLLGRFFTDGEEGVVLLSHRAWVRRFGGDPRILGKVIALDWARTPQIERYQVIGVMPQDFWMYYGGFEVFVPLDERAARQISMVGRLRDGISPEQAQSMLVHRDANRGWSASVHSWREEVTAEVKPALLVLSAAVIGLLLIALANVTSLLLARGLARRKEVAVRVALGASRWRLARQFLSESLLTAAAAAVLGVAISIAALRSLLALLPEDLSYLRFQPGLDHVAIDWRVALFASAIATAACILCGLVPLWQASRLDVQSGLKQGAGSGAATRETLRARRVLIAIETSAAVALLFGGALLAKTMMRIAAIPLGFRADHLLVVRVPVPPGRAANAAAYLDEVERRANALPGVRSAALTGFQPLTHNRANTRIDLVGAPSDQPRLAIDQVVSSQYFDTCGIALLQGALFTASESDARRVVVNEAFLSRFHAAVGQLLRVEGQAAPFEIAGVVSSARQHLLQEAEPQIYRSRRSSPAATQQLVLRTLGEPRSVVAAVIAELKALGGVVAEASTMDDFVGNESWRQRITAALLGGLGWIAFLMTAAGVYGLVTHMVARQTRDIGIRIALGAGNNDVRNLILRQGLTAPAVGAIAGIGLAIALGQAMRTLIYGVVTTDALLLLEAFGAVFTMALLACLTQLRKAVAISPALALRSE